MALGVATLAPAALLHLALLLLLSLSTAAAAVPPPPPHAPQRDGSAAPAVESDAAAPHSAQAAPVLHAGRPYDVAVVTQLPGRAHPLRLLASLLASAAATNAFGDARRVFVIVNSHYNESDALHRSSLLQNLGVGRTSVHFLPPYYQPQQASGSLYAMELYLRRGGNAQHGLLLVEDDIVFGPDFDVRLAAALAQCAGLDRRRRRSTVEQPFFMLRMYSTTQDVFTDDAFPRLEDAIHDRLQHNALETMPLEQWANNTVRAAGGCAETETGIVF